MKPCGAMARSSVRETKLPAWIRWTQDVVRGTDGIRLSRLLQYESRLMLIKELPSFIPKPGPRPPPRTHQSPNQLPDPHTISARFERGRQKLVITERVSSSSR